MNPGDRLAHYELMGPFASTNPRREFCVTADGQRFLVPYLPEETMPRRISVVFNWVTELESMKAGDR